MLAPLPCEIDRKISSEGRGEHVGDSMDGSVGASRRRSVRRCDAKEDPFSGFYLGQLFLLFIGSV